MYESTTTQINNFISQFWSNVHVSLLFFKNITLVSLQPFSSVCLSVTRGYKDKYDSHCLKKITKQSNAEVEFLTNGSLINNKLFIWQESNIAYNLSYRVINQNVEGIFSHYFHEFYSVIILFSFTWSKGVALQI